MMTKQRLQAEKAVLEKYLKPNTYRFMDMNTGNPYIVMAVMTNSGKVYTIRIMLREFPNSVPSVQVITPIRTKRGRAMNMPDGSMHVLGLEDGHTLICHYGPLSWTPNVSLFKVYMKCRLWFEMYEEHLRTGAPIDTFLPHQD